MSSLCLTLKPSAVFGRVVGQKISLSSSIWGKKSIFNAA
jgi:hypothetical protein